MSNILIVDDEQSYRQLLSLVFEGDGHLIRTASNGREALELLQAEPADIVIYGADASLSVRLRRVLFPLMLFYTRRVYRRLDVNFSH